MPADNSNFGGPTHSKKSIMHWIVVFLTLCVLGGWVIPAVQRNEEDTMTYNPPDIGMLRKKLSAIRISGIDFVSENFRSRTQDLMHDMGFVCSERSDDVIFAFQFGPPNKARRREEHIFALCKTPTLVYGNADIVARSEDEVMCEEEYGGELRRVRRYASVTIKAIDIKSWEVIEFDASGKDACIAQHAIDVLESKWV